MRGTARLQAGALRHGSPQVRASSSERDNTSKTFTLKYEEEYRHHLFGEQL
jgi:hypothetical protein